MPPTPETYFFRLLFYQLSETATLCGALATLRANGQQVEVVFARNEAELLSRLNERTLVVARDPASGRLLNLLHSHGLPFCIGQNFFESRAHDIFQLYQIASHGEVVLAFLSVARENELRNLFTLFGFHVLCVRNPAEFSRALNDSTQFCIIDQDLPPVTQKKAELRARVYAQLKAHRSRYPLFAVGVIKDFNQGSLFEDIISPVKEFCNALLSPEEFFLFIRDYLFRFETEVRKQKIRKIKNENFFGEKMNFGFYLRDIRKAHNYLNAEQTRENARQIEQALIEMQLVELRHQLTAPMARHLELIEGEKRGGFEFIGSSQAVKQELLRPRQKKDSVSEKLIKSNIEQQRIN